MIPQSDTLSEMDRMIAGIMADHEQHKRAVDKAETRIAELTDTFERLKP